MSDELTASVRFDAGRLRSLAWRRLGIRFSFGAAESLVAGLVGMWFGDRFGGLFLAFPAILPASLTLIERTDGRVKADTSTVGAALGGVALILFGVTAHRLLSAWPAMLALGTAAVVWAASAVTLFFIARSIVRRLGLEAAINRSGGR